MLGVKRLCFFFFFYLLDGKKGVKISVVYQSAGQEIYDCDNPWDNARNGLTPRKPVKTRREYLSTYNAGEAQKLRNDSGTVLRK